MGALSHIVTRGSALAARDGSNEMSSTVVDLLIVLLVLVFVSLVLLGAIITMRRVRKRQALARQQLPFHNEKSASHNRRLTISTARSSIYVYDEKAPLESPTSPNNVPEIRITFPDEHDEAGQRKSGRVLVVRVGETSVGLEPLQDEQLPAYEKEGGARFQSIDMERIGGLKEKSSWS